MNESDLKNLIENLKNGKIKDEATLNLFLLLEPFKKELNDKIVENKENFLEELNNYKETSEQRFIEILNTFKDLIPTHPQVDLKETNDILKELLKKKENVQVNVKII